MPDAAFYTYPSPLEGYEGLPPLSEEKQADGKSLVNPPSTGLSAAYERFEAPIDNGPRGGFDVHIYYYQENAEQRAFARALWERIRREFPELRVYRLWDKPIGPHTLAMFEVNLFSPTQFGAFVSWLVVHRGPLSALVHPNTDDEERDHSQRACWLGHPVPIDMSMWERKKREAAAAAAATA